MFWCKYCVVDSWRHQKIVNIILSLHLTLKLSLTCAEVSWRWPWQAPMLQKQPVRRWIQWSWASWSTCGDRTSRHKTTPMHGLDMLHFHIWNLY